MKQGKGERKKILIESSLTLYLLLFLFLIRFSFSQYREEIILPDSLGGIYEVSDIVYNEIEDRIYLTSSVYEQTVVVIDCENDERIFPIKLEEEEGEEVTYHYKILWHKNNNCIYIIRGKSYNWDVYWDSILIFNGHNHQRIKSIPLPPNLKDADFSFISNYVNNKVYLYAKSDERILFLIIDGSQNRIIEERDISRYNPVKLIFNPYNNFIYFLSDSCLRKVYLFSCELDSVIDSISLSPNLWWNEYTAHLFLDSLRNHFIITGLKYKNLFVTTYIIDYHTNQIIDSIVIFLYPQWRNCEYNFRRNKLYFWSDPLYNEPPYTQIGILDIEQRTVDTVTFDYAVKCVIYNHHNDIVYCDIVWEDIVLVDGRTNRIIGTISTRDVTDSPLFCHPKRNKIYTNLFYFGELGVIEGNQNIVKKYVKFGCSGSPYDISYNSLTNKIYFPELFAPYIIILDGETHRTLKIIDTYPLTGQIWVWFISSAVCTTLNKIYFSTWKNILVMDGAKDSIIKIINGYGGVITYNPFNNKLYVVSYTSFPFFETKKSFNLLEDKRKKGGELKEGFVCIIDCKLDSILKVLQIPCRSHISTKAVISPDGSKIYIPNLYLYYLPFSYFVICGFGDTLIKEIDSLSGRAVFKNNSDTLYIGCYDYALNPPSPPPIAILNWKKDTIIDKINGVGGVAILYNPMNNYLYSVGLYPNDDKIFVIDCATNNVIDTIFNVSSIPYRIVGDLLIWNPITNKIYGGGKDTIRGSEYQTIKVIDCRTNEIIKTIPMPLDFRPPYAFNPRQNCLYFNNIYQSKLIVIKDELTGIYSSDLEKKKKSSLYPTIGKDFNIILKEKDEVVVYNSVGRKVKSFIGENISIKGLKKGIYFVKLKREKELKKVIAVNDL